tara:strand:+ start:154 stop:465 length:312 start_codon:yes stop_codon:yes gene_type:complete
MTKKELLDLTVKTTSFYYNLNQEDKKRFKNDFFKIDEILEGIYNQLDDDENQPTPKYSNAFTVSNVDLVEQQEQGDRQAQLDKEEGFDNIDWVEQEDGSIEYV